MKWKYLTSADLGKTRNRKKFTIIPFFGTELLIGCVQ